MTKPSKALRIRRRCGGVSHKMYDATTLWLLGEWVIGTTIGNLKVLS